MTQLTYWHNATMVTLDPQHGAGQGQDAWGLIQDAAMLTQGEVIQWVGAAADCPSAWRAAAEQAHDLGGALVTPGLIDAHTHLVYGGERASEFELRLHGASYEDIARAGGGIRSTVAATRAASDAQLMQGARLRAHALMASGVTTVEIKSGYGLSLVDEARCLRVARHLGETLPLAVQTTSLAAHALPPEYLGQPDAYIDAVCDWLPQWHAEGLVDAVDAFCEHLAFSPAQTRRVFEVAQRLGLPVKLHAEQLSDQGGTQLAASFHALSCDHLEWLSEAGVAAMAQAGTVAMLLPGAFYFLRETRLPPVAALRAAGVPMAIATDHNPGTSPALSLPLMMNMACTLFRMTPFEALLGVTVNAARALGLSDRGQLIAGQRADFIAWDLDHPRDLSYWLGAPACRQRVFAGQCHGLPLPSDPPARV